MKRVAANYANDAKNSYWRNSRRNLFDTVESPQEKLFAFAIDLPDVSGIDFPHTREFRHGNDGLRHRSVPAGGTDVAESFLEHAARSAHVSDVANGDDVIRFVDAAHEGPLDSFEGEAEVRHLRDKIVALHAAQVNEC